MGQCNCVLEWVSGGGDNDEPSGDIDLESAVGSKVRCRLACCASPSAS